MTTNARKVAMALLILIAAAGCDDATSPPIPIDNGPAIEELTFTVGSDEYLNNRFFFLDLSRDLYDAPYQDVPGRPLGYGIDQNSIKVYEQGGESDAQSDINIAAYLDTTGVFWSDTLGPDPDFTAPYVYGGNWRQLTDIEVMVDHDYGFVALDVGRELEPDAVLAVTYAMIDFSGVRIQPMDDPDTGEPTQPINGRWCYRMKLLKAAETDEEHYSFRYVLRNIYPLGDPDYYCFDYELDILRNQAGVLNPHLDENGFPYIQMFGLDQTGEEGGPADGEADFWVRETFDLSRGLLKFPLDFMSPFNAPQQQYEAYANDEGFEWENTYLAENLAPALYDPEVPSVYYDQHRKFNVRFSYKRTLPDALGEVSLDRTAWSLASAMVAESTEEGAFTPQNRIEAIRWFQPRDRVLARYLDPDLTGTAATATVTAMNLFLHSEDDWDHGNWGGVMQGLSMRGDDISHADELRFWINDAVVDPEIRSGTLHIDFGRISEDFFWPTENDGSLVVGRWDREDGILPGSSADGVWTQDEDIGLDGNEWGPQRYDAAYESDGTVNYPGPRVPYPGINGTARNNRNDTEDLNGNTVLDTDNSYFTFSIDLSESAYVDVLRDCDDGQVIGEFIDAGLAWRQYRIPLNEALIQSDDGTLPDLESIHHIRIWFEDGGSQRQTVQLQFADVEFVSTEEVR